MNNVQEWVTGEVDAKKYLIEQGYRILEENFKTSIGEIDLIALDPKGRQINALKRRLDAGEIDERVYARFSRLVEDTIVFVEVKTRSTDKFGDALFAIDASKRRKICQVANIYLKMKRKIHSPARFDCIGITNSKITHIENAFENIYG